MGLRVPVGARFSAPPRLRSGCCRLRCPPIPAKNRREQLDYGKYGIPKNTLGPRRCCMMGHGAIDAVGPMIAPAVKARGSRAIGNRG
jgi:hypothetical protein